MYVRSTIKLIGHLTGYFVNCATNPPIWLVLDIISVLWYFQVMKLMSSWFWNTNINMNYHRLSCQAYLFCLQCKDHIAMCMGFIIPLYNSTIIHHYQFYSSHCGNYCVQCIHWHKISKHNYHTSFSILWIVSY